MGMVMENGPFLFSKRNATFERNEYSWNRIANVVYLESPAGVGFSYSTNGDARTNDDLTADENYVAIKEFLKEFPHFRNHDIFLTGESYAGIYIPMLADRIIEDQKKFQINLKGIAIGNGCLNFETRPLTALLWNYYHGLISETLYRNIVEKCCYGSLDDCKIDKKNEHCGLLDDYTIFPLDGIDIYDISRKCADNSGNRETIVSPCSFDGTNPITYFHDQQVRKALHIPTEVHKWAMCNSPLTGLYYSTNRPDMSEYVRRTIEHGVRTLLYYGDQDTACDFIMVQKFAANLKLPKLASRSPWLFNGAVAGHNSVYKGLTFLTIRGAGHFQFLIPDKVSK